MINLTPFIIYEDKDMLAINKPAGLVVHPDGRTEEPSVSEWFVQTYPFAENVGEPIEFKNGKIMKRPGVVHRIDRDTSGVLLLAKTHDGFDYLKAQFQNREIEKTYQAFVYGKLKEDHGTINFAIGKSTSDFRKWSAERGAKGEKRDAVTYYQVLACTDAVTLVDARPKTGRTHQIRVHFKALHHPVVADTLYASSKLPMLGFERLALHARRVVCDGMDGEKITITAPYPADFLRAFEEIGYVPKELP